MNSIEITPSKILRDGPVIFKIPQSLVGGEVKRARLIHSRGETEVPLRRDQGYLIGELTLGEAGEYSLEVGSEKKSFLVHDKEDLSFAGEFWFLAICVTVLLMGFIRWDWKRKKSSAGAGSF